MSKNSDEMTDALFRAEMIRKYNSDPGPNSTQDPGSMFWLIIIGGFIILSLMS